MPSLPSAATRPSVRRVVGVLVASVVASVVDAGKDDAGTAGEPTPSTR